MTMIVIKRQTPSSTMIEARWRGGSYVDLFWVGGEVPRETDTRYHGQHHGEDGNAPFINFSVWDHAAGKPSIDPDAPDAEEQLAKRVDEWIDGSGQDWGLG